MSAAQYKETHKERTQKSGSVKLQFPQIYTDMNSVKGDKKDLVSYISCTCLASRSNTKKMVIILGTIFGNLDL